MSISQIKKVIFTTLSYPIGKSGLMLASSRGNIEIVDILLNNHARVDQRDKRKQTALHYAVNSENGENLDVVASLLAQKCDINSENDERSTPLIKAVEKNYQKIAEYLLSKGAVQSINH